MPIAYRVSEWNYRIEEVEYTKITKSRIYLKDGRHRQMNSRGTSFYTLRENAEDHLRRHAENEYARTQETIERIQEGLVKNGLRSDIIPGIIDRRERYKLAYSDKGALIEFFWTSNLSIINPAKIASSNTVEFYSDMTLQEIKDKLEGGEDPTMYYSVARSADYCWDRGQELPAGGIIANERGDILGTYSIDGDIDWEHHQKMTFLSEISSNPGLAEYADKYIYLRSEGLSPYLSLKTVQVIADEKDKYVAIGLTEEDVTDYDQQMADGLIRDFNEAFPDQVNEAETKVIESVSKSPDFKSLDEVFPDHAQDAFDYAVLSATRRKRKLQIWAVLNFFYFVNNRNQEEAVGEIWPDMETGRKNHLRQIVKERGNFFEALSKFDRDLQIQAILWVMENYKGIKLSTISQNYDAMISEEE